MRAALTVAAKDLRLRLRDRSALVLGIVAPFFLAFILNAVGAGATAADEFSVDYGVVDHDQGEVAAGFVAALEGLDVVDIELTTGLSEERARDDVDGEKLQAVFVIPEGFSRAVSSPDDGAEIDVIGDVDEPIATQIATAIAERFTDEVNGVRLSVATAAALTDGQGDIGALIDEALQQSPPVEVVDLGAEQRELDGTTYLMAGIGVLFLFFVVRFGVMGLLDERREGTMTRLLAAPIPRAAIPAAKALTSLVLGVLSLGVLVVASTVIMGADWGPVAAVGLLTVGAVLAATSIMGLVATVARTPEQAASVQTMIALVLGVVGGSFFRVSQAEGLLRTVAKLTPHHWFVRGLGEASAGGVSAALPALAVLLAFAVVVGGVSLVFVPRMVGR
jgi:ABC-2 type transport system permease protein